MKLPECYNSLAKVTLPSLPADWRKDEGKHSLWPSVTSLRSYTPVIKASMIGLGLDTLPALLFLKYKLSHNFDITELVEQFKKGIKSGSFLKHYLKMNSWLTTLLWSSLVWRFMKPQRKIAKDSETEFEPEPEKTSFLSHFLTSLASVSVGLYFFRYKTLFSFRKSKDISWSLYLCVQALHTIWVSKKLTALKNNQPWEINLPSIKINLKKLGQIAEVGTFGLSCYQIMTSWFYVPDNLPKSYSDWITKFSHFDPKLKNYFRDVWDGKVNSNNLKEYCLKNKLSPVIENGKLACQVIHPQDGTRCSHQTLRRFNQTFQQAFWSTYLPLNVVAYLFRLNFKYTSVYDFLSILSRRIVFPSLRSSAFLSTFVNLVFTPICLSRNVFKTDMYGPSISSALCGTLSILVESPARRLNLALYVIPRALDTLYRKHLQIHILPSTLDLPLLAISLSTILTYYQRQPQAIPSPVRKLLDWIHTLS